MVQDAYTVSIHYDKRLYKQDIAASKAHARMLAKQGIVSGKDVESIIEGLTLVQKEMEEGVFPWKPELEDVHMNVEARLFEIIGDAAGRLHTARSRNDQVNVDVRLYTKEVIQTTVRQIIAMQESLLKLAEDNLELVVPGYTHMQRAQPVLLLSLIHI